MKDSIVRIARLFLVLGAFLTAAIIFSPYFYNVLLTTGVVKEEVLIAGTGSMYPTFPKSQENDDLVKINQIVAWPSMRRYPGKLTILGLELFSYKLSHGDIVEFSNAKTDEITLKKYGQEAGFVKRIIALPGDTIELRDGFVYLNGQVLDEPYTAKPRSTYGGDFLPDCKILKIPESNVIVLGDNRKASLDTRHDISLVSLSDIGHVLPWSEQQEYRSLWRDTKGDLSLANKPSLNPEKFVYLLNQKREKEKLTQLTFHPQLRASAQIRAKAMVEFNDFSKEASKSGITMEKSMSQAGYYNILLAEVFTRGFYEAEELIENFEAFPETDKLLKSKEYQHIGIDAYVGKIDHCPVQVVVAQFGGYVPPNYSKDQIESWRSLVEDLEEVIPSWAALKDVEGIDQDKVARLVEVLNTRLVNARRIYSRMEKNQWLTSEEKAMAEQDGDLAKEAEEIISSLKR